MFCVPRFSLLPILRSERRRGQERDLGKVLSHVIHVVQTNLSVSWISCNIFMFPALGKFCLTSGCFCKGSSYTIRHHAKPRFSLREQTYFRRSILSSEKEEKRPPEIRLRSQARHVLQEGIDQTNTQDFHSLLFTNTERDYRISVHLFLYCLLVFKNKSENNRLCCYDNKWTGIMKST